jgi:hypothetical protein
MTDRQERRKSCAERWCFVCGETIAEAQAVYDGWLGFLTHQGACSAAVDRETRVYDRSPRGRWRPAREVRQRLRALRPGMATKTLVVTEDGRIAWKIATRPYGSEGEEPCHPHDCPYYQEHGVGHSLLLLYDAKVSNGQPFPAKAYAIENK